ncbi:MAG: YHS domain-containing protein [Alphaproteobacteria bacterium]|nr:YHS domain-containing protein [Alphaproteobacteria bacterium]
MKVTDPMCGSEIEFDDSLPRTERGGWVYFFCSTECRRRFLEDPERHAVSPISAADAGTGCND